MATEDFQTVINSLGRMAVDSVRGLASQIGIVADPDRRTACVTAFTEQQLTDDEFDNLLARMITLSDFFSDELALDFFIRRTDFPDPQAPSESLDTCEFQFSV